MNPIDLSRVIELPKVIAYIRTLQKKSGGFGATRRLPATIEDTYHSIAIFRLLAADLSVDSELADCRSDRLLLGFIERMWANPQLDVKTIYQLYATAMDLNAGFDPAPMRALAAKRLQQQTTLRTYFYTAMILGSACLPLLQRQLGPEWLYRIFPLRRICEGIFMALGAVQASCVEIPEPLQTELIDWLQRCQTPDGGFGFMPGTTSFIENTHFCLKSLTRLQAKPEDTQKAVAFISRCQTRYGGFGRRGLASPFLDSTYHAIASLSILA